MKIIKTSLILTFLFWSYAGFSTIYQAETAKLYKAVTETKNTGYTGDSYINFDNETGSYLELIVGMANEGEQTIKIRFANGSSATRPMEVNINNQPVAESLEFLPTGNWTNWDTIEFNANFNKGINTLQIISTGSEGGPNIDYFDISGEQAQSYTLSIQISGPGTVIQKPDFPSYFEGQEVQLIASPDINGIFSGWDGGINSDADTTSILMNANKSVTANFEEINLEIPEPDFSLSGYASVPGEGYETTTGGEGGEIIYIKTIAELQDWAKTREDNNTPEIVVIQGYLEASTTADISIKYGKNLSILGDSETGDGYAELKNISLRFREYSNVIIRNLKMHEVFYPNDDLTIEECHHVWIDHCEFHSKIGTGIGVDTYDGLLDIKKGSHNVTVSWCYLHDHMKTMLIGHSDSNGDQDQNLEVTIHHCWFSNTDGRNPSLRFGHIHYFNNYLDNIDDYGFAVRNGAHAKIENNHFESVNIPVATDKFQGHGFACLNNNIYSGTCTENHNQIRNPLGCEYWDDNIPYNYTPEEVNTVALSVQEYAGVGVLESVISSNLKVNRELSRIKFWPNPVRNILNVQFRGELIQNANIEICSLNGQALFSKKYKIQVDRNIKTINIRDLKDGIYILKIKNHKTVYSEKLIISK